MSTRKNKRPEQLVILGRLFDVKWGRDEMPDDSREDYGHTEPEARRILINTEMCAYESEVEATLLHEAVHASLALSGVESLIDEKLDEAIATCLENALYPLLLDLVELGYFRRMAERTGYTHAGK